MRHLVLAGGGHAHLHLLKQAARIPPPAGTTLTLVSPDPHPAYSGMVPGYLQGHYRGEELSFDLPALTGRAGIRFVEGWVREVSVAEGTVRVEQGGQAAPLDLPFHRLSLDVGSVPRGLDLPGVREHAVPLRPLARVRELRDRLDALAAGGGPIAVVVVGGGAAGVETVLALHRRLAELRRQGKGPPPGGDRFLLVEGGDRILRDDAPRAQRTALRVLKGRVEVVTGAPVARVSAEAVHLDDGRALPSHLTVWVTGASPPPLLARSDLPLDPEGFFQVDARLRAVNGAPVWGAGDCVALAGHPRVPRAGVHAVRQGPVLAANLLGPDGHRGASYRPQASFLSLLNTGDGRALLRWKGVVVHTRWALWLKDRIDRGFMARHRA